MRCPKCSSEELKVLETRADKVASTRRRRECLHCNHRFSTIEEVLREDLAVVKRDGRRESFDRTKLAMGLRRAIAKRPIDAEQINALLSDTLRRIENEFDNEVPSRAIADAIMQRLRKVDAIAWLRYASFYQDFHGLSRFAEEVINLGVGDTGGEDDD
ncbi:MAG: transcriptional regulator NrdR [Opitutae bacterium]|nr:transcriptional regulator NrdR [Opitutae bacterium]MEC8420665.1 transcriptional regulator NrdR [Verrucomicrobiota bacterium]